MWRTGSCGCHPTEPIPPRRPAACSASTHTCGGHRHKQPPCAYIAVWYRDHWFYIDDRDQESKATLLLMLQLRQLDFKKQVIGGVPALTLPVGR